MISKFKKIALSAALIISTTVLVACGGSGAGGLGSSTTSSTSSAVSAATAASLVMTADSSTLDSDGRKTITLTAITKNADNVVLKSVPISFSSTDAGVTLTPSDTKTNEGGIITATVKTTDKTTRTIKVNAKSDTLSAVVEIAVLGTTVSVNGPTGLGFGAESEYSVVVKDSGGNPVVGKAVTVKAANTVSVAPPVTDAQGQTKFKLVGSKAGSDTISVEALGTSSSIGVSVTSKQLVFVTPAPLAELPVGNAQTGNIVTLRLVDGGVPQAGQTINLTATRGTIQSLGGAVLSPANLTTGADGSVSFQVLSTSAGIATLTATANDIVASQKMEFVARIPSQISFQAGPSVVGVNLTSASSNAAQLIARVTDGTNPVKGVRVDFSTVADPSGGRIEPAFGVTDSYGQATASYIAGAVPSGNDLVSLKATVVTGSGPVVAPAITKLTVAQQEISIRLGAGSKIAPDSTDTKYVHPHTVLVTDNAGRPISGAKVTVTVQPTRYFKGIWTAVTTTGGDSSWQMNYSALCQTEDANLNGLLDPGEDSATDPLGRGNGNGRMDPGNVASAEVTEADAKTSPDGFAAVALRYPKIYGLTAEINLTVSILAPSGTEAKQSFVTLLTVAAADVNDIKIAPPGILVGPSGTGLSTARYISPFGEATDCRNPN